MSRMATRPERPWPALRAVSGAAVFLSLFLILACGSEGTGPAPVPVVSQVVVSPASLGMTVGEQSSVAARVLTDAGEEIHDRSVQWTSSNETVATVSSVGVVNAISAGSASITATVDGKSGTAALTVSVAPVASVQIDPSLFTIEEGDARALTAIARDAAGRVLTGRTVTWVSTNPAVVSVNAAGTITAIRVGQANVNAIVEGTTASADVRVILPAVATVSLSPIALVLEIGEQRQMQAIAKDSRGNVVTGRTIQWAVDSPSASITPAGLVTGVRHGYVTVSATSEGVSGAIGGTVIENAPYEYDLVYHRLTSVGASELFTLELGTGSPPVRLNAGNVSRTPTPSPDGSRIAFAVSMRELGTGAPIDDIFAVDRNGLNMRRLTTAPGYDDSPSWSPAGGQIAWHHWDNGRSDIWVMNADGSAQVNLTGDLSAGGFRSAPTWTYDGTRIAFAQTENGPAGTTASIWVMKADGSEKREVTSTLSGFDSSPSWSPDGRQLAFTRHYGPESDITIINIDDGSLRRIPLPGLEVAPAWSPDGALIAFTQSGTGAIYTVKPNGSSLRLRTIDPAWGGGLAPEWIRKN